MMASKYPSVTAQQAAAPSGFVPPGTNTRPPNIQKGNKVPKPANDNSPGGSGGGGGGKTPIGKVPKPFLTPGKIGRGLGGFILKQHLKRIYDDALAIAGDPVFGLSGSVNTRYWSYSCLCAGQCPGDRLSARSVSTACNTSSDIDGFRGPAPIGPFVTVTSFRDFKQVGVLTAPPYPVTARGTPLWRHVGTWSRRTGAPVPTPVLNPSPVRIGVAVGFDEFPLAVPLAQPSPHPRIVGPAPGDEPSAQPQEEKKPDYPGKPRVFVLPGSPWPINVIPENPLPVPIAPPGIEIAVPSVSGGGLGVRPSKKYHQSRKPAKGEIEKKINVRSVGNRVWMAINTVTEAMDFVVAMHKSIPKGKHRLSDKASKAQVIEYMMTTPSAWRHIDAAEGVENYINMQFSDYVAAFGSGAIKDLSRQMNIVTGLDRAVNHGRRYADETGIEGPDSVLPVLDIDRDSGLISLVTPFGVISAGVTPFGVAIKGG